MISSLRQNPSATSFKRNLKPFEIERLESGDIKTLLDVGIKTGQGIITPDRGALGHLGEYIQENCNKPELGFLPAVLEFFADYKKLAAQKRNRPYLRMPEDALPFVTKNQKGMLGAAFDLGAGRLPAVTPENAFLFQKFGGRQFVGHQFEAFREAIPKRIEASCVVLDSKHAEGL